MEPELAYRMLKTIASQRGDMTVPSEDVIDIAQAVLALFEASVPKQVWNMWRQA